MAFKRRLTTRKSFDAVDGVFDLFADFQLDLVVAFFNFGGQTGGFRVGELRVDIVRAALDDGGSARFVALFDFGDFFRYHRFVGTGRSAVPVAVRLADEFALRVGNAGNVPFRISAARRTESDRRFGDRGPVVVNDRDRRRVKGREVGRFFRAFRKQETLR